MKYLELARKALLQPSFEVQGCFVQNNEAQLLLSHGESAIPIIEQVLSESVTCEAYDDKEVDLNYPGLLDLLIVYLKLCNAFNPVIASKLLSNSSNLIRTYMLQAFLILWYDAGLPKVFLPQVSAFLNNGTLRQRELAQKLVESQKNLISNLPREGKELGDLKKQHLSRRGRPPSRKERGS